MSETEFAVSREMSLRMTRAERLRLAAGEVVVLKFAGDWVSLPRMHAIAVRAACGMPDGRRVAIAAMRAEALSDEAAVDRARAALMTALELSTHQFRRMCDG